MSNKSVKSNEAEIGRVRTVGDFLPPPNALVAREEKGEANSQNERSINPAYVDRYCAFVDILGFRHLIDQMGHSNGSFESLRALLARVHNARTESNGVDADFRVQSISDAVAISTSVSVDGLGQIFEALIELTLDLLVEGYFIRGAIVRAPLYHDENMVVGKALVSAYEFESKVAKYPRIIVTRAVKDDLIGIGGKSSTGRQYPKMENLRPSADGPMYLDALAPVVALLRKADHPYKNLTPPERDQLGKFRQIREKIQLRYEEAMDAPGNFEKVRWFAQYWNEAIPDKYGLRIRDADRKI